MSMCLCLWFALALTISLCITGRFLNVNMDLTHYTQKRKDITHLRAVATEAILLKDEAEHRLLGDDIIEGGEVDEIE